jgi:serine/threonine protein kinase
MSTIPRSIGPYTVVKKIGSGGQSEVFLAQHPVSKERVAVKLFPRGFGETPKRFKREMEAIHILAHSNIIQLLDMGTHKRRPYYVMPYMERGSLEDLLEQKHLFTLEETTQFIVPIAEALDFAHYKGIVHRDLKPANILLDEDLKPYVSDFGLAKVAYASSSLTGTQIIGTPYYMSPEQIQGKLVDCRNDVYSLGVILYEMLAAKRPFDAQRFDALMYQHVHEPIPNILNRRSDLPSEIGTIIQHALSKNKNNRFKTAGDLAKALVAVTQGLQIPENVKSPMTDDTEHAYTLVDLISKIKESLVRIITEQGDTKFVIFSSDESKNYYVQFMYSDDEQQLVGETVSNEFLLVEHKLNREQTIMLSSSGWQPPHPNLSVNFFREWNKFGIDDCDEIAQETVRVLTEIYGCQIAAGIKIIVNIE